MMTSIEGCISYYKHLIDFLLTPVTFKLKSSSLAMTHSVNSLVITIIILRMSVIALAMFVMFMVRLAMFWQFASFSSADCQFSACDRHGDCLRQKPLYGL